MTTRVPFAPPQPPTYPVMSGRPVSSSTWGPASELVNYLMGHGAQVIPATHVPITIAAAASKDIRFKAVLPYACTTLLWTVSARSTGAASSSLAVTTPTSGSSVSYSVSTQRGNAPIRHIEQRTSKSGTAQEISIRLAPTTYGVSDIMIGCVALPRATLVQDTTDRGIDAATEAPRQPIYTSASGAGISLGQLAQQGDLALVRARRNGIFAMPLPDNTSDAISVTGATTLYGAAGPIGGSPVLARKLYSTSTTGLVTCEVLAWASVGATTYGAVTGAATSGGTLTVNLGTAGSRLTTTPTWYSGTVSMDCEDLTASDGRRSTRWDDLTWTANRTAGADTIYVATISGYEA